MTTPPDPKMLRIHLGIELRRLREQADRSTYEAAEVIGCKQPKLSKIESGAQGVKPDEVARLAELYGASAEQRDYLVGIAERQPKRSRPKKYHRDAVPDWFQRFLALESDATEVRLYEVESVAGLLQTEGYARSMIQAWEPAADARLVDRQVQTRMQRQSVLTRQSRPVELRVVLSEAALRRIQGSPEVMAEQMKHLITMSEYSNVEVRVLPFEAPNRISVASSLALLRLAEQQLSAVYLEDVLGATYLWEPEEFTHYSIVLERLRSAALPPEESREFLGKVATTYG